MDGRSLACGAVAGVATVRHPVVLARRVMERSPYVLLAGDGAERFADEMEVERVTGSWFAAPGGRGRAREDGRHGTVGAVALDREGHLAAATSTGGLSGQRSGRVGAVPLIGSGTWADRDVAVSCSGRGEEFIRHGLARELAALVELAGMTPDQAARKLVFETLKPDDGGLIAVGRDGSIAVEFNTGSMVRASADSTGRFDLAVWY
jgi:beta-aspartyl-peptidase (threonine type)